MRLSFVGAVRRVTPPWLQRTEGARLLEGVADVLDDFAARAVEGVKARFPGVPPRPIDPDALALTGRERRIRRGPGESASSYARRLLPWWDAHRTRGGPYALLAQLRAFFLDLLGETRIDVVYHSGTRRWLAPDGTITRDAITWNADGTDRWARFWVFFHLGAGEVPGDALLVTQEGEPLITQDGDPLVALVNLGLIDAGTGTVTEETAELFRALPREWSAAHIDRVTVVLLHSDAALVGYPPRLVGEPGQTVGRGGRPVILVIEGDA